MSPTSDAIHLDERRPQWFDSRAVIWFEDEVEAFQKAAVERQQTSPPDPDPLIRPKRKTLGRRVAGSDGAAGAGEAA